MLSETKLEIKSLQPPSGLIAFEEMESVRKRIFSIQSDADFEACALAVFHLQYKNNVVYRQFVEGLKINPNAVSSQQKIPFLPIGFFKTHAIITAHTEAEIIFTSSGTTGNSTSAHLVADISLYQESYLKAFEHFYGKPQDYCIIALLPSYSERSGSSLIYMVDDLISKSNHPLNGYYLKSDEKLVEVLMRLKSTKQKTLLIGVTYALLDFADAHHVNLNHCIIMETGGMKGKRKELVREDLHRQLKSAFAVNEIHSEYGMTELLSQAYSKGNGIFQCPPWMRVEAREIDDPLSPALTQKTGGLNVIDLANLNSCSFIATQDLGKVYPDKSFEVLGRFDNSDIRGCNLLL